MVKLGQTDSCQNVNVRVFGGTDKVNSVGPMCSGYGKTSTWFDQLHKLGETNFGVKQTENRSRKLGGTDRISRWDQIIATCNREFARPSR